jgi:hypothetical protein
VRVEQASLAVSVVRADRRQDAGEHLRGVVELLMWAQLQNLTVSVSLQVGMVQAQRVF